VRVLFAGSPDAALPCLRALVEAGVQVVGVLTQPARPVGRKKVLTPTPVESFAHEQGLAVFTPSSPDETSAALKACSPDVAIVVAYGRLLDQTALEALPQGWWNVHFSLLPRWRGAAPQTLCCAATAPATHSDTCSTVVVSFRGSWSACTRRGVVGGCEGRAGAL